MPATKANPKEMMPIVDKPLIQYAVEEAIATGVTELIFVTSSSKRAIEDHFDSNFELEAVLQERGKMALLNMVRDILPKGVTCAYVRQQEALGLGHAVLCAKPLVNDEPFAVLLADDLIDNGEKLCLQQMVEAYEKTQQGVIAVETIEPSETHKYGVVAIGEMQNHSAKINGIIEKPAPADAPSNLGVVGRYILPSKIFALLEETQKGAGGEIQLTDGIAKLLDIEPVHALQFHGTRYDCGNKLGYFEATLAYAKKHPEIMDDFKQSVEKFL